jgi:hypothetical protein
LVQAFLKKWWIESDFKAPNLPLSLRLKGSGVYQQTIENAEREIKNGQSKEIGYTRRRQSKQNASQCVLDSTIRKHTQITEIKYEPSYKQLEVKTNQIVF